MTAVCSELSPLRFQGGVAAPLINKVPFLICADRVVSNFQQKIRRLRDLLLTTPSAPLRNRTFLWRRSHPSLKTEGNGPVSQPTHSPAVLADDKSLTTAPQVGADYGKNDEHENDGRPGTLLSCKRVHEIAFRAGRQSGHLGQRSA